MTVKESSRLLDDAAALIKAHDLNAAVGLCQEVLRSQPKSSRAFKTLGLAYALMGSSTQACEAYRRYLKLAPWAADRETVLEFLNGCSD